MTYELWDGEMGQRLGLYETEAEALAAVRAVCAESNASTAPLGLVADGQRLVAAGDELVQRARRASTSAEHDVR